MERVALLEHQFLIVEKESIEKWKEDQKSSTDSSTNNDRSLEIEVENLKKQVESLKPVSESDVPLDDIEITTIKESNIEEGDHQSDPFTFLNSGDDPIKITAKESDEASKDDIGESDLDSDNENKTEIPKYKFPTF